jgi:uncharacterized membrane protein
MHGAAAPAAISAALAAVEVSEAEADFPAVAAVSMAAVLRGTGDEMNKLKRAFRHLTTTKASGRRLFPTATLHAIRNAIAEGEVLHRAEVRLIVEAALDWEAVFKGMSSRDRASELFTLYRIWDTEENCGVLIYINLADRRVEIIADRGLAKCVPAEEWQNICRTMTHGFAQEAYHDSVLAGLRQLNALLAQRFPENRSAHNDQLSNQPVLL